MPKVDVIIPAYNAARYLPAAIESVVAQTFEDWRIVLVDDGSTDDTAETVAPFVGRLGSKLKYIKQENRGLPAARNTAIRNSDAEFLALLDADDMWLPERLAESLKSFEGRPQVGLSYGLISWVDANGLVGDTFAGNLTASVEGRIATHIYTRKVQLPCPTMTFLRVAVDEVGMFDEMMRATEDRDLWLRIALRYDVAFVPKVIGLYRLSPGAMSADPRRMLRAQLGFVEKHYGAEGCGFWARRIAVGRIYKQHAEALERNGRRGAALGSALKGWVSAPFDGDNWRTVGSLVLHGVGLKR
jgi:glycosyltransferase involved in cell wall biosynthesis